MVQRKLENMEQPSLASCNFVLALNCRKNPVFFYFKTKITNTLITFVLGEYHKNEHW